MRAVLIAALLLAAPAAHASGGGGSAPAAKAAPYVDVYPFAAPVVQDGRLVNYVFVQLRLHATLGADGSALKKLEPQLRDAIVREAHRAPFIVAGDPNHIDDHRLTAFALATGRRLAGAQAFASAEVRKQTPKHVKATPGRAAGAAH